MNECNNNNSSVLRCLLYILSLVAMLAYFELATAGYYIVVNKDNVDNLKVELDTNGMMPSETLRGILLFEKTIWNDGTDIIVVITDQGSLEIEELAFEYLGYDPMMYEEMLLSMADNGIDVARVIRTPDAIEVQLEVCETVEGVGAVSFYDLCNENCASHVAEPKNTCIKYVEIEE